MFLPLVSRFKKYLWMVKIKKFKGIKVNLEVKCNFDIFEFLKILLIKIN